jgi:hypothetical protein
MNPIADDPPSPERGLAMTSNFYGPFAISPEQIG